MIIKTIKTALLPIMIPAALAASCSGGSGLGGDTGQDPDAHDVLPDSVVDVGETSDPAQDMPVDLPVDETTGDELPAGCEPQDAHAEGPCAAELPGVRWDGSHCTGLGSGCSCAGADCGDVYDTVEACVDARRACFPLPCEAHRAAQDTCILCYAETYLGSFWTGRECFDLWGCGCAGEDCGRAFASAAECAAVTASCDSALCESSGGMWFPASAGFCGFYCGVPTDDDCEADSCNCGPGRSFVSGEGCRDDPVCRAEQFCRATRGAWHPQTECFCGFTCGMPNDCEACVDSCDCGPHRNFQPGIGCASDIMCEAASAEEICTFTGGRWHEGEGCGDFFCGIPNMLDPCVMPGCDCGALSNFDSVEGCTYSRSCLLKTEGQDCMGHGIPSSCRPGLLCCNACGIPPGCSYCQSPCCPDDPGCGEDGCPFPPP
jgi:hypothetical protein